jgi:branched-chain amino acid transport system ATP-binding protein
MSVVENVTVGAFVRYPGVLQARAKALDVLDYVGLAAHADASAADLTPPQKRRLEVARALATEPKLLLLDEVLTGLTPSEAAAGVDLIRKVRETGVTVVMVEHVMEVVMPLVDRAVVLHLGKVLAEGLPKEVVRDDKVIAAYLGDRHRVA